MIEVKFKHRTGSKKIFFVSEIKRLKQLLVSVSSNIFTEHFSVCLNILQYLTVEEIRSPMTNCPRYTIIIIVTIIICYSLSSLCAGDCIKK